MNIYIMLAIVLANIIAISIVYQFIKKLDKKEKIIFIAICVAIIYMLISVTYWISGFNIDKQIHKQCKDFITYMFVPVDVILFIPYIAHNYMKYKDKKIKKEELFKKVFITAIIAIIVLIGEYFYFKNIQNNIKQISQNTKVENKQTNLNVDSEAEEQINSIITNIVS